MNGLLPALQGQLSHHGVMVLALSFAAGVASSFLPCTIAMLPVLVGYIGGYAGRSLAYTLGQLLLFIVGLALTMAVLGIVAATLGVAFGSLIGTAWYYVIGALAVVMGLHLLGWFTVPLPQGLSKLPESKPGQIFAPLLLGIAFGTASSPCGTPFLAAILGFISRENNIALGGAALFCYALGQGVLLLVAGLFTGLLKHIALLRHVGRIINTLSGVLFLVVGAMLIAQGAGVLVPVLRVLHLFPTA